MGQVSRLPSRSPTVPGGSRAPVLTCFLQILLEVANADTSVCDFFK